MHHQNLGNQSRMIPVLLVTLFGLFGSGCVSNQPKQEAQKAPEAADKPAATAQAPAATAPAPQTKPVCKTATVTKKSKKNSKTKAKEQEKDCVPASTQASAPEPAPAAVRPATASQGGYDLSRNKPITDSSKVEAGKGTLVKGLNDWEGEISGVPAGNSRFTRLRIGMPQQQVIDLVGQPTDQGAYLTGKAFIPFYHGSDRTRYEMIYKGQGRLIFSNQAGFGSGHYLTWIIHNANEGGYR